MKDRWKIFWISVFLGLILAALFLFMGFSLRKVDLLNYGVLRYDYYDTVDINQSPRTNGNYLVGLDYSFLQFSKGFLVHEFRISTLTKDKSMIEIDGMYMGKLVYSELVNLYFTYGFEYRDYLFSAVDELFHQAIEQFTLNELISNRVAVDSYVKNYVKSNLQSNYQWAQTKFITLGAVQNDLIAPSVNTDTDIQLRYLAMIKRTLQNQRKLNVYQSGGLQLISDL